MDEPRFPGCRPAVRSCSGSGGPGSATTNARDTVVADHVRRARRPFRPDGRSAGEGGGRQGQERQVLRFTVSVTSGSAAWTRVRTSRQRRRCRGCIPGTASRPAPRLRPTPSRHSGNPAGTRRARGQSGDITGAITELRQLLTDQQRVLGSGHPLTLTIRAHLTRCEELPAPQDRRSVPILRPGVQRTEQAILYAQQAAGIAKATRTKSAGICSTWPSVRPLCSSRCVRAGMLASAGRC
jgi:hypothetical protein